MKHYSIILLLIISSAVLSQKVEEDKESYELKICMKPSFSEQANFTINYNKYGNSYIYLKNSHFDEKRTLNDSSYTTLNNFLATYEATKTNNIEVISTIKGGDTSTITLVGFDGITVLGSLSKANSYKEFEFWSPKQNTSNYRLIKLFFSITDTYFIDEREREYINSLKGYFKD